MPNLTPASPSADRNLLFGILAVQMDFVSRDALIAAMNAWVLAKHRPLGDFLVEAKAMTPERQSLLDALADEHLKAHGGDAQRSLAAMATHSTLGELAGSIADPELQANLAAAGETLATTACERPPEGYLRYRILRPHAQGGLGVVSVAQDLELGREVAFKEIQVRFSGNANHRSRFVREAEITGRLEHPGIVPVYGLGRYCDGRPYYAMRLIRGESLQEATRKLHAGDQTYTLRALLTRFVAACNAVAYAHSRGVIHRDIKPANVMLGPFGDTLVVDWGLAKVIGREIADENCNGQLTLEPPSGEESLTQAGSALGTPAFMSPEQAQARLECVAPASDVYSLGATLYVVLTGRAPFEGSDIQDVLKKVREGDFAWPRERCASVPPSLEAICIKAMALYPDDRYQTPRDLVADIERWLADEPVSAYSEPLSMRQQRWARRNRMAQRDLWMSHFHLADLSARFGDLQIAKEHYERSLAISQQQALADPGCVQAQHDLAISHNGLGNLQLRLRDYHGARFSYGKNFEISERLAQTDPTNYDAQCTLSFAHNGLGEVCRRIGDLTAALGHFRAAIEIRQRLANPASTSLKDQRNLMFSYNNMGNVNLELGDIASAKSYYEKGLGIAERLAQSEPTNEQAQLALYYSCERLGLAARRALGHIDAVGWYDRALAILRRLECEGKLVGQLKYARWKTDCEHALVFCKAAERAVSEEAYALSQPNRLRWKLLMVRGQTLAKHGEHVAAAGCAAKMQEVAKLDRHRLYAAACAFAAIAAGIESGKSDDEQSLDGHRVRELYSKSVLELLRTAIAAGYSDVAQLRREPEFNFLRSRTDFREFINALETDAK
jgi:serine/threonine protein kinase